MRHRSTAVGLGLVFALAGPNAVAWAEPAIEPADDPASEVPEPAPIAEVGPVPEAAWAAVRGKQVAITSSAGDLEGELAATEGDTLVVITDDGTVKTLAKAKATGVRVRKVAAPSEPAPAKAAEPKPDAKAEEDADEEKPSKRKHALLGAFTAHGAAYTNWRGRGVSAGGAAYAMDWGIGVNPTPGFGMYAVAGGLLGAKIDNKTINANYGHVAFAFAFGGKYYFSMIGAGVAFNRLKLPEETQKDIGLSVPMKLFGRLPLPHHLYLGIGLSYELGIVRDFHRFVNGIGGQIVFGRW